MTLLVRSGAAFSLVAIALLGLGGCTKEQAAPPVAALPPPPPPAPLPPLPPSPDDQLQAKLGQLGAAQTSQGWMMSLTSAQFRAGKVSFEPAETDALDKIAELLKSTPNLRVVIDAYPDSRGSTAHKQELSQMRANAVLRNLTADGADAARIQAVGLAAAAPPPAAPPAPAAPEAHAARHAHSNDRQQTHEVQIIFSNAEGEFPPPAGIPSNG